MVEDMVELDRLRSALEEQVFQIVCGEELDMLRVIVGF